MAEIKKKPKPSQKKETKFQAKPWLEDKIKAARKLAKPYASRVSRYGISAGVVLTILLVVASLFLQKSPFQSAKERLTKDPHDFEAHLLLAEEYLENNQLGEAEKELLLAQEFKVKDNQVLGQRTSASLDELWQRKREANPEEIKKSIQSWKEIITEKPDYRDGYLQLALLHYKLYEDKKAEEYLQEALTIDPNFEAAKQLEELLRSN